MLQDQDFFRCFTSYSGGCEQVVQNQLQTWNLLGLHCPQISQVHSSSSLLFPMSEYIPQFSVHNDHKAFWSLILALLIILRNNSVKKSWLGLLYMALGSQSHQIMLFNVKYYVKYWSIGYNTHCWVSRQICVLGGNLVALSITNHKNQGLGLYV